MARKPPCLLENSSGRLILISKKSCPLTTAIFIIEGDAQDGSDHVDARRTVGLVVSPLCEARIVDSTLYSTSSMVRSIELLLGLPPMSQYDAAAMPMYVWFGTKPVFTPFSAIKPLIDVNARNTKDGYGAEASSQMDFSDVDRMQLANGIIWKSVKGTKPNPIHDQIQSIEIMAAVLPT